VILFAGTTFPTQLLVEDQFVPVLFQVDTAAFAGPPAISSPMARKDAMRWERERRAPRGRTGVVEGWFMGEA
jgi:hypothetical protein